MIWNGTAKPGIRMSIKSQITVDYELFLFTF